MAQSRRDPRASLLWGKQYSVLFSPLSFNLLSEICKYLQPLPYPFWVTLDTLAYFSTATKQTYPIALESTIQVNANSRWTLAQVDTVVVCGGGNGRLLGRERGLEECVSHLSLRRSAGPAEYAVRTEFAGRYSLEVCGLCVWVLLRPSHFQVRKAKVGF